MLTSTVIERLYKGVRLVAMRSQGRRYEAAIKKFNGETWYSGCRTVSDARERIKKDENIKELVLYIYHPKKKKFEIIKHFVRS